jgi:hypothetical protein
MKDLNEKQGVLRLQITTVTQPTLQAAPVTRYETR